MRLNSIILLAALVLTGCAIGDVKEQERGPSPNSEAIDGIVLRINVEEVKFTDFTPTIDCPPQHVCIPMNYFFRYKAIVKEVIRGHWSASDVEFVHLQHAEYKGDYTDNCYVILMPIADGDLKNKLNVKYGAKEILFPRNENHRERIRKLLENAP